MKRLNSYITEKLHIDKDTKITSYKYFPENRNELVETIISIVENSSERDRESGIIDLNSIDTSKIDDMNHVFYEVRRKVNIYNVDISKWDVSNVKEFDNFLCGVQHFNCDLSEWDVSKCEDFESMFEACYDFEGKGLEKWNFQSARKIRFMFTFCYKFDADVSNWDLRKVVSISRLFDNCKSFKGVGLNKMKLDPRVIYDRSKHRETFEKCESIKKLPSWYEESK